MSTPKVGSANYPRRKWEIWNDNYSRLTGEAFYDAFSDPWTAWHPVYTWPTSGRYFATHAEAIEFACSQEMAHLNDEPKAW